MQSHELLAQIVDHFIAQCRADPRTSPNVMSSANPITRGEASCDKDTKLGNQTTQIVDELRSLAHQKITRPMQRQQGLLLDCLDRNKAHRRTCHRLADRFGINGIRLPAFDVWLHIHRRDQPNLMAQGRQFARPMMAALLQDSMPIRQGSNFAKKDRNCARRKGLIEHHLPLWR